MAYVVPACLFGFIRPPSPSPSPPTPNHGQKGLKPLGLLCVLQDMDGALVHGDLGLAVLKSGMRGQSFTVLKNYRALELSPFPIIGQLVDINGDGVWPARQQFPPWARLCLA